MADQEQTMTVEELYNYIVQHLTPEEALKRLIATQLEQYNIIKSVEGDGSPYVMVIIAARELGWNVAFPQGKGDETVNAIAIGTEEGLSKLLKNKDTEKFLKNFVQNCQDSERLDAVQTSYFGKWAMSLLGLKPTELLADKNISGFSVNKEK